MIAFLPVLSILMLAISTVLLDVAFADAGPRTQDFSHLDDPNAHPEELVTCKVLPQGRIAKA